VEAQVLKQADVLQLLAIHDFFPEEVIRANFDYYEPRTEHGSSLSPSVHAIVANRAGYTEKAYSYFMEAGTIDLYNASKKVVSGGSFLGGIHTAACGAIWQVIVHGFAGFKFDGGHLVFQPALPEAWKCVSFALILGANRFRVIITYSWLEILGGENNREALIVHVKGQSKTVSPGEKARFELG
jgi:kojibiose phosphorylase